VLAGRRGEGDGDALPGPHRALVDVAGVPMLLRVVRTLRATPRVGRLLVSIDDAAALDAVPELRALVASGALETHQSLDSPSRSVQDVLASLPRGEPALVTTADHALLTPEMVQGFLGAADATGADVVAGAVGASLLRARYPESRRTLLRLGREGYHGANLFAFRTDDSRGAAAFWVRAERFRKQPWRLAGVFGPITLVRFLLRRLDLDAALERISDAIGVQVRVALLPFPEAAIDVDRPDDLALANQILAARGET